LGSSAEVFDAIAQAMSDAESKPQGREMPAPASDRGSGDKKPESGPKTAAGSKPKRTRKKKGETKG
jgi:hypothetical protein